MTAAHLLPRARRAPSSPRCSLGARALLAIVTLSCGGAAGQPCVYRDDFAGTCRLESVVRGEGSRGKVKLLASYLFVPGSGEGSRLAPLTRAFEAGADREAELRAHLDDHGVVACRRRVAVDGGCAADLIEVDVPAFEGR